MSENLNDLSDDQLEALLSDASALLKSRRIASRRTVTKDIREQAAKVGLGVEFYELDGREKPTSTRKKLTPKYADPDNPDNTWTGGGTRPKWLKAYLEAGRELTEFLIQP